MNWNRTIVLYLFNGELSKSVIFFFQYYEQYMKNGMKYEERTIRLTKLQILFSKYTTQVTFTYAFMF